MRRFQTMLFGVAMLGLGYLLGTAGPIGQQALSAQNQPTQEPSDLAVERIQAVSTALREAADRLQAEGRYEDVTDFPNAFLILSGGGSALEDLEAGNGVDPETFAALYAGHIVPELADRISWDANNRLLYNGQVVRMYSRARLQRMYAERLRLREIEL